MRDLSSIKPRRAQLRQIRTVLLGPSPGRAVYSVASSALAGGLSWCARRQPWWPCVRGGESQRLWRRCISP